MTLPDNFSTILTDLQKLQCWPKSHHLDSYGEYKFTQGECDEDYPSSDNINDPLFTPWLTSLAMHLLGHLENRFYLSESIIDIESDGLCIHLQKHTNTPQSIAIAIIQAAHAVLVEKK